MAVYYKWIKGTKDCNTYMAIEWPEKIKNDNGEIPSEYPYIERFPIIKASADINFKTFRNWGHILTDKADQVLTDSAWTFGDGIGIVREDTDSLKNISPDLICRLTYDEDDGFLNIDKPIKTSEVIIGEQGSASADTILRVYGDASIFGLTSFESSITVKKTSTFKEAVTIEGACNATYFNATSDKRAKENIKIFDNSAVDFIAALPVYSFNYKNHKDKVLGILAQDLLKVQKSASLDLVNNTTASGEDGDYMTIKEDKLIYLCMKAIQEQQKEIQELKIQVQELKNQNK